MMALLTVMAALSFVSMGLFCIKIFKEEDQLEQQAH